MMSAKIIRMLKIINDLKKYRKTTVPHARDKFQPSYKPTIKELPTLYRRNSVEAVRLSLLETTTCVESYLAQFEICAR